MLGGLVTWRSYYPCLMSWHPGGCAGVGVGDKIHVWLTVQCTVHHLVIDLSEGREEKCLKSPCTVSKFNLNSEGHLNNY